MQKAQSQYQHTIVFHPAMPDETSLETRLLEMGLTRETFSIRKTGMQSAVLNFCEPDRHEAFRLLARLEKVMAC